MRSHLPPTHFWFATLASERSLLARAEGNPDTAMQLADTAVKTDEELVKTDDQAAPFLPFFLYRRAALELERGDLEKSDSDAQRSINLLRASLGNDALSLHLGECYLVEAQTLERRQKRDEARAAFRLAATNFEKALGPDHAKTRAARSLAGM